ncbi:MAG: transglutaminase family protein [Burkholderiales bacterium]|nr:transglutaminase family protein [Opitutaceae bacterium]
MKLRVSHLSRYEYDREVGFSPHVLYLRPRESAHHRLISHRLSVQPEANLSHVRDPHDNNFAWAHFWEKSSVLNIRSEFELETIFPNPFDFILKTYAFTFPFKYEPVFDFALGPYLAPPFDDTQARLRAWLDEHFVDRPTETVPFLSALNSLLYQNIRYNRREERGIQPSTRTLDLGGGACRDYAVLLVELARTLGLAARFVSGYMFAPADDNHRTVGAMHAWAEVYLPGGGWRGLDPTHGIWCDESFIPVAHAAQAESINPIQGGIYTPQAVSARLHADVIVERMD